MCTSNMLYRIPSSLGLCRAQTFQWIVCARGKVARGRMRGHKGTVASLQRLYVIPQRQTKSALPYWMLVAIQHTPVPSSRNVSVRGWLALLPCGISNEKLVHQTMCPIEIPQGADSLKMQRNCCGMTDKNPATWKISQACHCCTCQAISYMFLQKYAGVFPLRAE